MRFRPSGREAAAVGFLQLHDAPPHAAAGRRVRRVAQAIADLLRLDLRHGVGGVLEGALEVRARTSNEEMELAAAQAIARVIPDDELHADYSVPSVFNRRVAESVAEAVANAAVASGVARRERGAGTSEPATPLDAVR